jgi:signal transduction histidine kinase
MSSVSEDHMLRGFRHTLFLLLQVGVLISGVTAVVLWPAAWEAVCACVAGSLLASVVCERFARRYLRNTLGRLRRAADDLSRGRMGGVLIEAQPGDDFYKLVTSINLIANRLRHAGLEERRLQEQLRRSERLAFLGELAACVAHEINNPLDGIQNCSSILRRSLHDPPRAQHMLSLMDSGLERIGLIVRRLLTLAREHAIRVEPTSLRTVIDAAVSFTRSRLQARGIEVEVRRDTERDVAPVDAALLEHVFVNLLVNAADSMSSTGEITVTIRAETGARPDWRPDVGSNGSGFPAAGADDSAAHPPRRGEPDDSFARMEATRTVAPPSAEGVDVLCVDVADRGSGITPEVLAHMFEPFFTTKAGGKGTGLGLAIASRIVDAHRGSIQVSPRDGGGSVFTVRLPACATRSSCATPRESLADAAQEESAHRSKGATLIPTTVDQ